jgi:cell division protein ZapA (FtsZ GTPase activity inhibitor)
VEVSLGGQSFTVKSEKDEAHLQRIAAFVNRKFDDLRRQTRNASTHELALLVAMNIADELFDAKAEAAETREEVRRRTERAIARIDAALGNGAQVESGPAQERYVEA